MPNPLGGEESQVQSLTTNRDFYLAIAHLVETQRDHSRTLEEYLRAILSLCAPLSNRPGLTLHELFAICNDAFLEPPFPIDPSWFTSSNDTASLRGYSAWRATLIRQIVDLVEMTRQATINDPQRYFGIDAPRGSRWYNFTPCTYLECATEGTIGGWEPGDTTGREFVPGQVAVIGGDGRLTSANPQDIDRPIVEIQLLSWDQLDDFLWAGQNYE